MGVTRGGGPLAEHDPGDDAAHPAPDDAGAAPEGLAEKTQAKERAEERKADSAVDGEDGWGHDDEWDEEESILTWKLLVGIVGVLVVVAVLAVVLFGQQDATESAADAGAGEASLAGVPAIRDSFDRPDNPSSLGRTGDGESWEAGLGTWGILGKSAYVSQANTGPRNVALIDLGQGDGSGGATAEKMVNGWGLVFRYRGPNAYWYLSATPLGEQATAGFNLFRMEDGVPTNLQAGCVKKLQDGSRVRVEFVGPLITVFVDETPICTVTDPWLQAQTKVGLFVTQQGAPDARWRDFVATKGIAGPPVTAKPFNPQPGQGGAGQGGAGGVAPTTTSAPVAGGPGAGEGADQGAGGGDVSPP